MNNRANNCEYGSGKQTLHRMARVASVVRQRISRAQAMVELALIAPVIMIGLVVGVQFAIIGAGALALSQGAYQGARYASIHSGDTPANVKSALDTVISPIVKSNYSLSMTPTTSPRATGTAVQVTLNWNASSMIVLPNPFFGISFPSSYSATETAYTE